MDFCGVGADGGPSEGAFFQPFGHDPEAGAIPVEEADAVAPFIGKDEDLAAGGRLGELVFNNGGEPIEAFS